MKEKIITSLYILFFIVLYVVCSNPYLFEDLNLNPNDYTRITDVDYKAVVVDEPGSEGKVVITERITFDVHAASASNLFWELWRDLPEDYVDGVKVHYKVNSVKQILEDGSEIIYEESPKLYWDDYDYVSPFYGPGKWYHSEGPYDESDAQYECVFFYVDGLYREEVVFEIEYEMYNAALKYNDCSDLYLAMYSGDTISYLDSYRAQILLPYEDMPSPGNYEFYTYGTNANVFPITESPNINPGYHTFYFELDEEQLKFKPYNQYIEFDLVSYGSDKHIFTDYAPQNHYTYDDVLSEIREEQSNYAKAPATYRDAKFAIFIGAFIVALITIIRTLHTKSKINAEHTFYEPAMETEYFRDIPSDLDPHFAAKFVFCKHKEPKDDSGIYSAILLSLARKDYIKITQQGKDSAVIIIKKQNSPAPDIAIPATEPVTEPLTPSEEYYFNLLVRHAYGNTIDMDTLQQRVASDYENTDAFVRNLERSVVTIGVNAGYFQKSNYDQPRKKIQKRANSLLTKGILLITLANIISYQTRLDLAFGAYSLLGCICIACSIYLKKKAGKYVLLTQFGEDEYVKWRGLYNFLNSDTLIHERTIIELPLWEKYLVYATAFGLSEKVIEAIRIRCPETSESSVLNNSYYRSDNFRHSGRSFRSSVRSGSHTARSGGSGFSGSRGGGGRGGGGGGGGH